MSDLWREQKSFLDLENPHALREILVLRQRRRDQRQVFFQEKKAAEAASPKGREATTAKKTAKTLDQLTLADLLKLKELASGGR